MHILPAIDLLGGRVVRLAQGDYNAVTEYGDDPIEQAKRFAADGAEWIHVVDLDGAKSGHPQNTAVIAGIIAHTGLNVEVGGGVRSLAAIETLAQAGAARVVIGSKLVSDPDFARAALHQFGELICAGVDARDGMVATQGWTENSTISAEELLGELRNWGVRHVVYTDIAKDGMQTGIDAAAYARVAGLVGSAVTASGGIASLADLEALAALGPDVVWGAIAGRAIYEGAFTVAEAVRSLKGRSGS